MTNRKYFQIIASIIAISVGLSCSKSINQYHYYPKYEFDIISGKVVIIDSIDTVSNNLAQISGKVLDKGTIGELPFVYVYLIGPEDTIKAYSDIYGVFEAKQIISETYILKAWYVGYFPLRDTITINEGVSYNLLIKIEQDPEFNFEDYEYRPYD